ncbi:MAG: Lrp/AsnC ligand binding domain-containing protein [Candidatus Bathyarchaeia archaeon]|nr:Lrp/AsnC ligand binding domain-containing protein [Candidatus Bathyarchaeota archaeon]
MISACVLIRTERGRFNEVAEKMKTFEGVKDVFTVFGRYDVVVDLEALDLESLTKTAFKMGNIAGVVFTETLIEAKI